MWGWNGGSGLGISGWKGLESAEAGLEIIGENRVDEARAVDGGNLF